MKLGIIQTAPVYTRSSKEAQRNMPVSQNILHETKTSLFFFIWNYNYNSWIFHELNIL